jgi:TonB family protein
LTDLNFVVDPRTFASGLLDATVTIHSVDQPWEQVLNEILASKGLSSTLEGNVLWIHPLGTVLDGDRDFTGDPIDLELQDARLKDVLDQFEKIAGLTINLQPGVQRTVTVDLDDVPWDQVLDLILRISGLGWSLDGSTVDVFPSTTALGRQLSDGALAVPLSSVGPTLSGSFDDSPVYRFRVGGAVTEPRRVSGPDPVFPRSAQGDRITGTVVVEAVIDSDGTVRDAHAILSPSQVIALATLDAVRQWRFEPATLEGKPVAVRYILSEDLGRE